ncbi:MAG: single-stranded DNA-binding protein [Verrucomicrobiae bacterium]|nr:single-stranded DNA-binding protein [Verrucomicrobiae bacterium]
MFRRNRIELTGNIAKSPRSARVGNSIVVRARLIHNETVERANGETIERLTAVEIEIWGKRGVAFEQHVTSNTAVYIEGSLQLAEWEKDGERFFRNYIRVTDWQFLLPKPVEANAVAA